MTDIEQKDKEDKDLIMKLVMLGVDPKVAIDVVVL